jgi:predicted nucleic acid-binding protein
MIVLDTNVLSEMMRPAPSPVVMQWLESQPAEHLMTTALTVAEIEHGIGRLPAGKRRNSLEGSFRTLLARGFAQRVLPFDAAAAAEYAEIAVRRERSGRPVHGMDLLIAAVVRAHGLVLATRNEADFHACGFEVVNPWA